MLFYKHMKKIQKQMKIILTYILKMIYTKGSYAIAEFFWF